MPQGTMLIVNPVSGRGLIKNYLLNIVSALGRGGRCVSVYVTEKRGDAADFARQFGGDYDRLVCNGGDGTLSEVVNGIMALPEDRRPAVGYIPLGTTNDMASSFDLPQTTEGVIEHLAMNNIRQVDVGQFGTRYFGYVAAFGAFTEISYATPQEAKNNWGYLAYLAQALSSLPNIRPVRAQVTYDGKVIEDEFIIGAVMNSTSVAGIIKLPLEDVALDDGIFEVLLVRNPRDAVELSNTINDVLAKRFNSENVMLLHASVISFRFDRPVSWTVDGEDGGAYENVTASSHRQAMRLLV